MVGIIIASMVGMTIREEVKGMAKPTLLFLYLFTSTGKLFSLIQFIGFFGPLIGIVLGFDAINRERAARGRLSKLASQPIYRDPSSTGSSSPGVTRSPSSSSPSSSSSPPWASGCSALFPAPRKCCASSSISW